MAAIDWGVIALRDGEIIPEDTNPANYVFQGAGGIVSIGKLKFSKTSVLSRDHATELAYDWYPEDVFSIDFMSKITGTGKKILYWSYNGTSFKTKETAKSVYLTQFKYQGHFYRILQGYDISLGSYWHKSTKKLVKAFLVHK